MRIKISLENRAEIYLISIVGVGNGVESDADVAKRQKN
jgi:hypothetical protein